MEVMTNGVLTVATIVMVMVILILMLMVRTVVAAVADIPMRTATVMVGDKIGLFVFCSILLCDSEEIDAFG